MEEKRILTKKVEVIRIMLGFVLTILTFWLSIVNPNIAFVSFLYWVIFLLIAYAIFKHDLSSYRVMSLAFALTIFGVILVPLGIVKVAEFILRIGYMVWIVGIVQALLEYRKEHG